MDVSMTAAPAPVSWKQVAVQKQEVLRTGGEGQVVRAAIETIQPTISTAKDGRVEVPPRAASPPRT